jgi:hypothetical protein
MRVGARLAGLHSVDVSVVRLKLQARCVASIAVEAR